MATGERLVAVVLTIYLGAAPALAQTDDAPDSNVGETNFLADVIEITPSNGSAVIFDGRRYGGTMRVRGHGSGLALVETVGLDGYLAGIQEVPFSWEPAALQAQAIAARTYLAWTLARGRTDTGIRYDYDICATDACQVYAGLEPSLAPDGERWLAAVRSTGSQVLLYEGGPALAYYSSTSGGRTRDVGDIWPDTDLPYLRGVESSGEDSPFASWTWWLTEHTMASVLTEAGLASGDLVDVTTRVTDDGDGPWTVTVTSDGGEQTRTTWEMRGMLNAAGPAAAPGILPTYRPDGARYPQTILSPSFTIRGLDVAIPLPFGGIENLRLYEVDGNGWGHMVGMSQYGAQAMAERGAEPSDILAHFYGGLRPTDAPDVVPDTVEVALATAAEAVDLDVTGPVNVAIDDQTYAVDELGAWSFAAEGDSVVVSVPEGFGRPPLLRPGRPGFAGLGPVLRPEVTAAASVEWTLTVDGVEVASFGPERVDAGRIIVPVPVGASAGSLTIRATNRHGGDSITYEFGG